MPTILLSKWFRRFKGIATYVVVGLFGCDQAARSVDDGADHRTLFPSSVRQELTNPRIVADCQRSVPFDFDAVIDGDFLSSGDFVVLDFRRPALVLFSAKGCFVRTLAGAGEGPGEMKNPTSLSIINDSVVVVFDAGLRRLTWISIGSGTAISTQTVGQASNDLVAMVRPVRMVGTNSVTHAAYVMVEPLATTQPPVGRYRPIVRLMQVLPSGAVTLHPDSLAGDERLVVHSLGTRAEVESAMGARTIATVVSNTLLFSPGDQPLVLRRALGSNSIDSVKWKGIRQRLSDTERNELAARQQTPVTFSGAAPPPELLRAISAAIPEHLPVLSRLHMPTRGPRGLTMPPSLLIHC